MLCPPSSSQQSAIAVTMGEPSGIGGELALMAWTQPKPAIPRYFIIDSVSRLRSISQRLEMNVPVVEIDDPRQVTEAFGHGLPVLDVGFDVDGVPGVPSPENANAVCASIELAVQYCLDGAAHAMTTNPIQKDTLYDAGFSYPGHTEYIAELSGGHFPVMMLASPMLRVVPIMVHQSLSSSIRDLSEATIIAKARIAETAMQNDFGFARPRMAIAGLNPHAGENGNLGTEETDIIEPAINSLLQDGYDVVGPIPPDALFMPRMRETYDVAICQYHDQALIPIKALDVDNAVNVTLGLPIVRTSPDHGTALSIAGTGTANPQSFIAALKLAEQMANSRNVRQAD